jgi:hypothetical protein
MSALSSLNDLPVKDERVNNGTKLGKDEPHALGQPFSVPKIRFYSNGDKLIKGWK